MKTASSPAAPEPAAHSGDVLARQSTPVHRDGRLFACALATDGDRPIDGDVLRAALAARGWSAVLLKDDLKKRVRKAGTLEAVWVISARHDQAALEAAVEAALAAQPKDLNDWLREFTESGQGAGFELEVFEGWSAAQWLDHEFGDDDDDEPSAPGDVARKVFAAFPAALRKTLERSRQVYAVRSEQASEDGAPWQPALAEACEAITRSLGESTRAVEMFELGRGRWGYRVW